jgi:hypothetical protein
MAFDLTHWKPFSELTTVRDEMDKVWNHVMRRWPGLESFSGAWVPSLDVEESKDQLGWLPLE